MCIITGKKARYRDPKTMLGYHDLAAFKELRRRLASGELKNPLEEAAEAPPVKKEKKAAEIAASMEEQKRKREEEQQMREQPPQKMASGSSQVFLAGLGNAM